MDTASPRYARRVPRISAQIMVRVTAVGHPPALARTVDISPLGLGAIAECLASGTKVAMQLLDAPRFGQKEVVSVVGTVVAVRPTRPGQMDECRLGVEFSAPVPRSINLLCNTVSREREPPAGTDLRAETPEERERCYQIAFGMIERGAYEAARDVLWAALAHDFENPPYQLLWHRVTAEIAFLAGQMATAAREVGLGLAIVPDDPFLLALQSRLGGTRRPD